MFNNLSCAKSDPDEPEYWSPEPLIQKLLQEGTLSSRLSQFEDGQD